MNNAPEALRVMCPLFQTGEGGATPTSALELRFYRIELRDAIALNRLWHSRLPRVVESNISRSPNKAYFGAGHGDKWYAIAIWTAPIAYGLPHHTWLELRRLAIAPDAPRNTASRMLAWMAREIKRTMPTIERLISYQDCDVHTGGIYRAAGWTPTAKSFDHRDRGLRPGRKRNRSQTTATKQRWEK